MEKIGSYVITCSYILGSLIICGACSSPNEVFLGAFQGCWVVCLRHGGLTPFLGCCDILCLVPFTIFWLVSNERNGRFFKRSRSYDELIHGVSPKIC